MLISLNMSTFLLNTRLVTQSWYLVITSKDSTQSSTHSFTCITIWSFSNFHISCHLTSTSPFIYWTLLSLHQIHRSYNFPHDIRTSRLITHPPLGSRWLLYNVTLSNYYSEHAPLKLKISLQTFGSLLLFKNSNLLVITLKKFGLGLTLYFWLVTSSICNHQLLQSPK